MNIAYFKKLLPFSSKTKFSGFKSRWIIFFSCRYSKLEKIQAEKNRTYCSVNLCFLHMWYRRSPPVIKSMTRYKCSRSWKACLIFTINLCLTFVSSSLSLLTDSRLFFVRILYINKDTQLLTSPSWRKHGLFFCLKPSKLCQTPLYRSHVGSHNDGD